MSQDQFQDHDQIQVVQIDEAEALKIEAYAESLLQDIPSDQPVKSKRRKPAGVAKPFSERNVKTETPPKTQVKTFVVSDDAPAAPTAQVQSTAHVQPAVQVQATVQANVVSDAVAIAPVVSAQPVSQPAISEQAENDSVMLTESELAATRLAATKAASELSDEFLFADLPLRSEVLAAVTASGYEKPTPIQAQIIPYMLDGRDVLAQSQTGSGKTAAFALPILSRIDMELREPQVLVLAPTRELAIQVANSFATYGDQLHGFSVATIYGGQDYEIQFRQLRRGTQVVVGTPGRVIDHINRGTLDLKNIRCLVLDEADEMLNMGFLEDVQFVLEKTPDDRQIALFSATMPSAIRDIADEYLNNPARITVKNKSMTADSIRQRALFVAQHDKIDVLKRILEAEPTDGVIVFTKTRESTLVVAEQLNRSGLSAIALNGDMPQKVRERAIEQLKDGQLNILVATDVAARGLDVPRVSHVFNYDLPNDSESYIHRVGRTGRAGRKGEAIIFLTNTQRGKLRLIERATKQSIELVQPPTAQSVNAMRIEKFKQSITDMTAQQDLSMFTQLLTEYSEQTGKPMAMIAAALAQISLAGRPFLAKDKPQQQSSRFSRDDDRGDRNDRGPRDRYQRDESSRYGNDSRGGSDRNGPPRGARRSFGPPSPGMIRYSIQVGRDDGVMPRNIVGAVANEGGIDSGYIGPIKIYDSYSTIDLPDDLPSEICATLKRTWVAGKQLQLRPENESSDRGSSRPYQGRGNAGGSNFKRRRVNS